MSQLPFAMARYAKSLGVEIRLNTVVDKVIVEDGTAVGVRLENGEEIRSFMVVSNADPKRTYRDLVDAADVDAATKTKVDGLSTRANCVKLLVALRELPDFSSYLGEGYDPRLTAYFRICPSVDYFQQSWDDAKNGYPSSCPVMNVQMPSIYDKSLTPAGHHVLSSWTLYAPAELKDGSWDVEGPKGWGAADRHIDDLCAQLPGVDSGLDAADSGGHRDQAIPDGRQHPAHRHNDEADLLGADAVPVEHIPVLHVRVGDAPRRRDHGGPGTQCRKGDTERPGAGGGLAPVLAPDDFLVLRSRLQGLESPLDESSAESFFFVGGKAGVACSRSH